MKRLALAASLLLHLVFLLLFVRLRFPLPDAVLLPRIVPIVAMSPPPGTERQAATPPLVYVRPFKMSGGPQGPGAPAATTAPPVARRRAAPPAADRDLGAAKASQRPEAERPAGAASPSVPLPRSGGETQAGVAGSSGRHLEIDTQRLARALRRDGTNGDPAESGAPFAEPLSWSGGAASLPAGGDGTRLGGGDGTASTAFGGSAFFASGGYDITPWAQRMVYRVKKNWILPMAPTFSMRAEVGIYLVIGRDGSVSRILIRKASGIRPYDQAALNAIRLSAPLPALPDDFPRADLPAYFLFHYQ